MKRTIFFFLSAVLLTMACGNHTKQSNGTEAENDSLAFILKGDSTVYGLVCDGCTDTILVFLPADNISADPDTFNILNATRRRHVFGELKVGDNIAVVRNSNDSTVADYVIDMESLLATWCYKVMPALRVRADMVGKNERQIVNNLPDSIRELLDIAREYSMQIKGDHSVTSRGFFRPGEDENAIVQYPHVKRYGQWHLFNGRLLLKELAFDTLGNTYISNIDTAEFMLMRKDTLVLKFNSEGGQPDVRSYYVKKE